MVPEQKVKNAPFPAAHGAGISLCSPPRPCTPNRAGLLHPTTAPSLPAPGQRRCPFRPRLPRSLLPQSQGKQSDAEAGRVWGWGGQSVPPAPARRGGRIGLAAKHNSITHRPINNRYQLLLWASIINTLYSNYTIIIMMNNLLVEIGLALQRQICKKAGDVVASVGLSGHRQSWTPPLPPNEGLPAAIPTLSPSLAPGFYPPSPSFPVPLLHLQRSPLHRGFGEV